jgi:transposase
MKETLIPSPLSVDLRERVVAAVAEGASCHRAAARFGVSVSSASRWSERFHHEGQIAARLSGGDHASHRIEAHADLILRLYEERPEIFLHELRDTLAGHGVQTSVSGLWRFFRRHRITRKKGRSTRPSRHGRT